MKSDPQYQRLAQCINLASDRLNEQEQQAFEQLLAEVLITGGPSALSDRDSIVTALALAASLPPPHGQLRTALHIYAEALAVFIAEGENDRAAVAAFAHELDQLPVIDA